MFFGQGFLRQLLAVGGSGRYSARTSIREILSTKVGTFDRDRLQVFGLYPPPACAKFRRFRPATPIKESDHFIEDWEVARSKKPGDRLIG